MTVSVAEALDTDTASLVTLEDTAGGGYVDGIFVPGAATLRKALGSFQQPSPQQLEFLEGSERKNDVRSVYLNKEVRLSKADGTSTVIIKQGKRFKVVHVGDWNDFGWFFAMASAI